MDEERQQIHSVDDYYPKSSSSEEPLSYESDNMNPSEDDSSYNASYEDPAFKHTDDEPDMMTCPKCGTQVPSTMNFCSLCGYHFPKKEDTSYPISNERIDGYLVEDINSFIGVNYIPYHSKFKKVLEGRISFNWAAAIFSNRWMAYRGMFRAAFLFSIILNTVSAVMSYMILMMFQSLGTNMSTAASDRINMFSYMLTVAIGLIVGLLGDSMYWKHTKKALDRFECKGREAVFDSKLDKRLRMVGGCKMSYALLIIIFDLTYTEALIKIMELIISKM